MGDQPRDDREETAAPIMVAAVSTEKMMNKPDKGALDHILNTMQRWLDGEPVWPYDRIIEAWGLDFMVYHRRWRLEAEALSDGTLKFDSERMMSLHYLRDQWIKRFGFAIPCAELLDEMAKADHIVEVAAGTGYMTRLMKNRGINVIGSDYDWRGPNSHGFTTGEHDNDQVNGTEAKTMVRRYPESTVFCSWPTLHETWFRQMLKAMRVGQQLVVIREGACAEETAWEYLDDCFDETACIDIPTFEHMSDYASVHIKKRQRVK